MNSSCVLSTYLDQFSWILDEQCVKATPQILKETDVTRQQLDLFVSFISSFLLYHWDRSWPIHLIHFFFLSPASLRSWALKAAVCKRPWRWHLAGKADGEMPWYSPISWPQTFCQRLHPVLSTCYSGPVAGHCWAAPLSCQTSQNSYALCNQMTPPPWTPCSDPQRVGSWLIPSAKVNKLSDITTGLTSRNNVFVLFFRVTGKTRPFLSHRHFKPSTHSTYNSLPWWACSLNKNVYNPRCPNMPLVFIVCLKKQS